MTLKERKMVNDAFKKAKTYVAWRNPFHVWFVTLYDAEDCGIFEFQFAEDAKEHRFLWRKIYKLKEQMKGNCE